MKLLTAIISWSARGAGYILLALIILITIDVSLRKLVNWPITGAFEVSVIGFLSITFLALGLVQLSERQMRIDVLTKDIKGRLSEVLKIVNNLLSLIFFGLLLWKAVMELIFAWQKSSIERGLIAIPSVIPLSAIVIGCIFICLSCLIGGLRGCRSIFSYRGAHRQESHKNQGP